MRSDSSPVVRSLSRRRPDGTLCVGVEGAEPDPEYCDCGRACRFTWWDDPRIDPPRWMKPRRDNEGRVRCTACTERDLVDDNEQRILATVKRWGVPYRYRYHRFTRHLRQQLPSEDGEGEQFAAFKQRVLDSDPPVIGITPHNRDAMRKIRDWRPRKGGPWLYIQGGVGTGKTLAAAALCRELALQPVEFIRGENGAFYRQGHTGVRFVSEHALQQAARGHFARRDLPDRDPVEQLRDVPVLVLDDLGTSDGNDKWSSRIGGVIDHRYNRELPTVVTSNLALGPRVVERFGHRVESRLAEMCEVVTLNLNDWRKIITPEKSARKRSSKAGK